MTSPSRGQHIGTRTWTINLDNVELADFGLLLPGAIEARSAQRPTRKDVYFTMPVKARLDLTLSELAGLYSRPVERNPALVFRTNRGVR
jgi:hypothetical protein